MYLVHPLGEAHVVFVGRHLDAGVQKSIELALDRSDHRFATMPDVKAADAAGKIEVAVAVYVFEPGIFGLGHVDGRTDREPAGYGKRRSASAFDFGPGIAVCS